MHKIKSIILKLFSVIPVVFVLVSGCATKNHIFRGPERQFVFVKGQVKISACQKETDLCLEVGEGKGYSSGVLISHSKKENKSYYLTAGHVCTKDFKSKNDEFVSKIEQEIHLFDYYGKDNIAEIIAIDEKHDMCLLRSKMVSNNPAIIKKGKVNKNIKVINVAAPAGIWTNKMMIHFVGEYQGERNNQAIYTLAAQPGSSGSPIYDPATGKLIGIITQVLGPSFDVSFGPTLTQINEFVDKHLPPI